MEFTSLCSGSAANCLYIAGGHTRVLVDAGCSCRFLERALATLAVHPAQISALLITHEHSDHISGAARISRRFGIPIFASELTWENLPFKEDFLPWERHVYSYDMEIGELGLNFFRLSHDAVQPVGLVFTHSAANAAHRIGVVTDTGCVTPSMLRALDGVDGLVLESNHSLPMLMAGRYPLYLKRRIASENGHLSNTQAADLLCQVGRKARAVLLAHLSSNNNTPQTALREFTGHLSAEGAQLSYDIHVAQRDAPHPLISLD